MRKIVVEVYTSLDGVIQPLDWMPSSETGREEPRERLPTVVVHRTLT